MQIGLGFNGVGIPLRRAVQLGMAAERAGYDAVWMAEDGWITGRDAVAPLATLAAVTERVALGTNLLPAHHTRHLLLLAATAASLDELSNGRLVLGLGAGMRWPSFPVNVKPLQMMREAIAGLRALLAGEEYELDGRTLVLQARERIFSWDLPQQPRTRVPIILAGRGPRMTALAGELAEGLLIELYVPAGEVTARVSQMAAGAQRVGRDPAALQVVCNVHITATEGELEPALRAQVANWYATRVGAETVERAGLDPEEVARVRTAVAEQGREVAAGLVTRPMIEAICAAGTPEACLKKLREYEAAGVTHAILMPFGGDTNLAIEIGAEYKRTSALERQPA